MKKTIITLLFLFILMVSAVSAETVVFTDKLDYVLGETVLIGGVNFNPNSNMTVIISRPDDVEINFQTVSNEIGEFGDIPYFLDESNAMDGAYYIYATDGINEAFADFWDCGNCVVTKKITKYINNIKVYEENLQTGEKWVKPDFNLPTGGTVKVEYVNTCADSTKKYNLYISGLCSKSVIGRPSDYSGKKMTATCSYSGAGNGELEVGIKVYVFKKWTDVVKHTEVASCDYACLEPLNIQPDIPVYLGNEPSLQQMLDSAGYSIDVDNDQANYRNWQTNDQSASLQVKYIGKTAGNTQVFGYYLSDMTFVPMFKTGPRPDNPAYDSVPILSPGQTSTYNIFVPMSEIVGFAIDTYGIGQNKWYTDKSLNSDNFGHAVAYDLCSEFVIGFEDLPESQSDKDYQDLVVSVKRINCFYPVCGNGKLEQGEECDDGNTNNNDACKNNCKQNVCGDGVIYTGVEECDDGNTQNGDGCSSTCQIEECPDLSLTIGHITAKENDQFEISYSLSSDDCNDVNGYLFPWPLVPNAADPEYFLIEDLSSSGTFTIDMSTIYQDNEGYKETHKGFAFIPYCEDRPDCDIPPPTEDKVFFFETPGVPEFTGMGLFLILLTLVVGYFAIFGFPKKK